MSDTSEESKLAAEVWNNIIVVNNEIESKAGVFNSQAQEKLTILSDALKQMSEKELIDAPMALELMGKNLLNAVRNIESIEAKVDYIINFIAQVMIERAMRTDAIKMGGPERLLDWVLSRKDGDGNIDYMERASLGGVLLKSINHDSSIINQRFDVLKKESNELIDQCNSQLNKKEKDVENKTSEYSKQVEALDERLNEYISQVKGLQGELSFLVLGKAFTTFIKEKADEKFKLFVAVLVLGIIVVSIPLAVFFSNSTVVYEKNQAVETATQESNKNKSKTENNQQSPIMIEALINRSINLLPITISEIILIFYFRILLSQFNSVSAQLLQLKMRLSICQFIESYVDFKKDSGDSELDKFESIIFSNLMPSAEQVPSTFDGIEQLGNLIKSVNRGRN